LEACFGFLKFLLQSLDTDIDDIEGMKDSPESDIM